MKRACRKSVPLSEKIHGIGERLRAAIQQRGTHRLERDSNLNERWFAQNDDLSWQQYGDGGDCWWTGCSSR